MRRLTTRTGLPILGVLAASILFPWTMAAGGCGLVATDSGGTPVGLVVGDEVTIEGFGFTLGDVVLTFSVEGVEIRAETVTAADAFGNTGHFIASVTTGAGEEGMWDVVATEVDGTCSAAVGFPVAGPPGSTAPPAPVIPDVATAQPRPAPSVAWWAGTALILLAGIAALRTAAGRRRN